MRAVRNIGGAADLGSARIAAIMFAMVLRRIVSAHKQHKHPIAQKVTRKTPQRVEK